MNPLDDYPAIRKRVYQVFWGLALILGCLNVGYLAVDHDYPTWLIITNAVFPFASTYIGYTAVRNTPKGDG